MASRRRGPCAARARGDATSVTRVGTNAECGPGAGGPKSIAVASRAEPAPVREGTQAMPHDDGVERCADKPQHLQSLAGVQRVAQQLSQDGDDALRGIGRSLAVLLERAQADLQHVLQHAREGRLVGVPPNLGRWPTDEAVAYLERHLDLLARVNPDDVHLTALLRRRPELFARAASWLEVARWHYERDHPGSIDPADDPRGRA